MCPGTVVAAQQFITRRRETRSLLHFAGFSVSVQGHVLAAMALDFQQDFQRAPAELVQDTQASINSVKRIETMKVLFLTRPLTIGKMRNPTSP